MTTPRTNIQNTHIEYISYNIVNTIIIERTMCTRIVLFKAPVQCRGIESIDAIRSGGGVIGFTRLLVVRVYIYRRVREFIIFVTTRSTTDV